MHSLPLFLLVGLVAAGCGGRIEDQDGNARGALGPTGQGGASAREEQESASPGSGEAGAPSQVLCDAKKPCDSGGAPAKGGATGVAGAAGVGATAGASGATGGTPTGGGVCGYDASALPDGYPPGGDPYAAGGCPCTRRQPDGSADCPVGNGETYTYTVGPEGGTFDVYGITYSGISFRLSFPPGAVATATTFSVTASGAAPIDFEDYTPLIRLEPADLVLAQPVPIRLGVLLPHGSGYVNGNLAIQVAEGNSGCFHPIDQAYINAGFVQGELTSFGQLFAGHLKPANLAACP